MKNFPYMRQILAVCALCLVATTIFRSIAARADDAPFKDERGKYIKKMIWGESVATPELHNQHYQNGHDCYKVGDGKWCYQRTLLKVAVPSDKYVFEGAPQIQCTQDNQGSAAWNLLGSKDRFFIELNNPNEVDVAILTGSHSIKVRIGCMARYYP